MSTATPAPTEYARGSYVLPVWLADNYPNTRYRVTESRQADPGAPVIYTAYKVYANQGGPRLIEGARLDLHPASVPDTLGNGDLVTMPCLGEGYDQVRYFVIGTLPNADGEIMEPPGPVYVASRSVAFQTGPERVQGVAGDFALVARAGQPTQSPAQQAAERVRSYLFDRSGPDGPIGDIVDAIGGECCHGFTELTVRDLETLVRHVLGARTVVRRGE